MQSPGIVASRSWKEGAGLERALLTSVWESEEWIKEHGQAKELDPATDPAMQALQNGE